MRRTVIGAVMVLVTVPVGALPAQDPVGPGREALRQTVVERFVRNFSQQAGLSEEQRAEFRQTLQQQFRNRQQLGQRRMQLLRAMEEQMRPGVAADQDSVSGLLESLVQLEEETAASRRSEQEAYGAFLTPVQRALLVISYERLQRQIQNIQRRQGQPGRNNGRGGRGNPPGLGNVRGSGR